MFRLLMGIAELTRNAVDVLPAGELERKLKLGRPLRVKLGIDVTAPYVTIGNGVPLQRMRAFQDDLEAQARAKGAVLRQTLIDEDTAI